MKIRVFLLGLLTVSLPLTPIFPLRSALAVEQAAPSNSLRIVILPFKNLTRLPADEWLSESFAESLTMGLLKLDALQLVERAQISNLLKEQQFGQSAYVDENTAPQLGKMLGAQVVVLGSYQKVGDQLQANVRFVDVATGKIDGQRAAQVTGPFAQIFDLQKQLATDLMASLNVQAKPAELAEMDKTMKATDSPEAYKLYMAGIAHLRTSDNLHLDKAREAFQQALQIDPNYALALAGLAEVHVRKARELSQLLVVPPNMTMGVRGPDDAALARRYANQALQINPNLPQVMRALAWVEQTQGHHEQAQELIEKAVRANPRDSDSLRAYVSFRFENGNMAFDLKQLQTDLENLGANLDDPWIQYTLATLGMATEMPKPKPKLDWIRTLLEQAQVKLPDSPSVPLSLYSLAMAEHKAEEAEQYFQKTLALSSNSPDMLSTLATMRLAQNKPQEALQLVQQAEALNPQGMYVRMTKAQILFAMGQKAESTALIQALEQESPGNPVLAMMQGTLAMAYDKNFVAAREHFQEALNRWETHSGGLPRGMLVFMLAVSEQVTGQLEPARKHFESLRQDPLFYQQSYQQLASIYKDQKNYASALEAYSAYLKIQPEAIESEQVQQQYKLYYLLNQSVLEPRNAAVLNDLALIYQTQKQPAQAIAYWEQALALDPGNAVVLYNFGSMYLTSEPAKALPLLTKAVAQKADYVKAWYNLGLVRQQLGDLAGARQAWIQVLALEPGNEAAGKALANLKP